jgi:hypothetical protein
MRRHPLSNALHRHLLARNEFALDQHAADCTVRIAVVRIVVDAQWRAVFEDHASRTFNLDREQIEWILQPADFKSLAIEGAGLDGAAVMIGTSWFFSLLRPIRAPLFGNASEPGL